MFLWGAKHYYITCVHLSASAFRTKEGNDGIVIKPCTTMAVCLPDFRMQGIVLELCGSVA